MWKIKQSNNNIVEFNDWLNDKKTPMYAVVVVLVRDNIVYVYIAHSQAILLINLNVYWKKNTN